ncbi:MAG: efflux RND transporter periplasmic adaptor subunit [Luteitalea sp.]|nr:efflux RND transporter periplasmic adaptor subunit [Luteitalea sp.]
MRVIHTFSLGRRLASDEGPAGPSRRLPIRVPRQRGRRSGRALARRGGLIVLFAAVLSACSQTAAQPAAPPPPKVTVAEVLHRDVTEWDEFTGRLEAVDTVEVRPRVSGYVSKVSFTEGALVKAGALLFQIDPRPFQAEVDRLRAELARARATVQRARLERDRAERLRAENAMSLEEHDRRSAFAEESAAQVDAVQAALRAAELNLEFTRVTAPVAGRVSRAIVTEGNLVSTGPGDATLLTTIVSVDPMYAYFDADEQVFLRYVNQAKERNGGNGNTDVTRLPIQMALANDTGFPREGRMDFLDNQVNPETGTIQGRAVFHNPNRDLTPGLFVRLRLAGNGSYRGVLIQDRAVGTDLAKKFVFVVGEDGKIEYRAVVLGPLVDGLRVVRSGLEPGDVVVVNGLQRVMPGVEVQPEMIAMDGSADTSEPEAVPTDAEAQE